MINTERIIISTDSGSTPVNDLYFFMVDVSKLSNVSLYIESNLLLFVSVKSYSLL